MVFDVNAFLKEHFFVEPKNFTNEQRKVLPTLNALAKKMKSIQQKKQIKNLLKLSENMNLQDAITYENITYSNGKPNAYVINQDWKAGDRHIYKHDTLMEILNRAKYISREELERTIQLPARYIASAGVDQISEILRLYPDKKAGEKKLGLLTPEENSHLAI